MILDFESEYFSQKESLLPAQYASKKVITYNPFTGLDVQSRDTGSETDFFRNNSKNKQEADQSLRCDMNAAMYFSRECRELRKTTLISYLSYSVLTKGKAIEIIIDNIDASLW